MSTDKLEWRVAIILAIGLVAVALSGCASGSRNSDYATNCGYALDQEGLCQSIVR